MMPSDCNGKQDEEEKKTPRTAEKGKTTPQSFPFPLTLLFFFTLSLDYRDIILVKGKDRAVHVTSQCKVFSHDQ
jgi:hypothetical protein